MSPVAGIIGDLILQFAGRRVIKVAKRLVVGKVLGALGRDYTSRISANVMLAQFKMAGYGVRRQWFLTQIKSIGVRTAIGEKQRAGPPSRKLVAGDMDPAPVNIRTKYSYQLQMDVLGYTETSPTTRRDQDVWGEQNYWFGSNKLMSPNEVIEAFQAKFRSTTMAEVRADWTSLKFLHATKRGPIIQ